MTLSIPRQAQVESREGKSHPGRRMTAREFEQWLDEWTRAEWVDGEVVLMAPSSLDHAEFSMWLHALLQFFTEHHGLGHVFGTEVLVRLPKQRRRLPDVMFVSAGRAKILQKTVIDGAPDLIMEIVSTDSFTRDWREKYHEYERAGVREYLIIDRISQRVEAYGLGRGGKYRAIAEEDGKLSSTVVPRFYLRPQWVLGRHPPALAATLRELRVTI